MTKDEYLATPNSDRVIIMPQLGIGISSSPLPTCLVSVIANTGEIPEDFNDCLIISFIRGASGKAHLILGWM